jgi:hypothetical protein
MAISFTLAEPGNAGWMHMILTFFWKMKGMDMRGITDMTMVIATSEVMTMSIITTMIVAIVMSMITNMITAIVMNMTTSRFTGIFRIYILSSTGWIPAAR